MTNPYYEGVLKPLNEAQPYFLADEGQSYCVITLDGKVHNFGVRT